MEIQSFTIAGSYEDFRFGSWQLYKSTSSRILLLFFFSEAKIKISIVMSSQIHFLLQVALLRSLVDGKVFMEWVGPAVLKAYQWQASNPTPEAVYPNN